MPASFLPFGDLFFIDACREACDCFEAASSAAVFSNIAALLAIELIALPFGSGRVDSVRIDSVRAGPGLVVSFWLASVRLGSLCCVAVLVGDGRFSSSWLISDLFGGPKFFSGREASCNFRLSGSLAGGGETSCSWVGCGSGGGDSGSR